MFVGITLVGGRHLPIAIQEMGFEPFAVVIWIEFSSLQNVFLQASLRGLDCSYSFSKLQYSPEEMLGMVLNYSRALAEDFAGRNCFCVYIEA